MTVRGQGQGKEERKEKERSAVNSAAILTHSVVTKCPHWDMLHIMYSVVCMIWHCMYCESHLILLPLLGHQGNTPPPPATWGGGGGKERQKDGDGEGGKKKKKKEGIKDRGVEREGGGV